MRRTPMGVARPPRGPHPVDEAADPLDDAVRGAQAGSEAAFTRLFREFQPRLLRYLQARCGDSAQDVAAETWARVVADLHRFRGDSAEFAAWLFTIARYRAIDDARAAARRPVSLPPGYDVEAAFDVERLFLEAASMADVRRLLAALPQDQAEAVALRVVAGLDVRAVAQLLGKSDNAVRICTHRGLRRLEDFLSSASGVVA